MKVVFESAIDRKASEQLEAIVQRSVADRRLPADARVYISRQRTGWSVFVSGIAEHLLPVTERIRAALLREAPEGFGTRHLGPRRLPRR